jgi:DNA-dependent RNA polymerase auxiliary subunit epsilon
MNEEKINQQKIKDKEYFVEVLEFLKAQSLKLEQDLEVLRNKKVKGPPKKQKEKQG